MWSEDSDVHKRRNEEKKMRLKTCLNMLDIIPYNSTEYFSSQSVFCKKPSVYM